ncbi:hypothetical protein [Sphingobacterium zeae]|uniref:Uncharacterized protein n=1 Tax=Sphingobacterium zeae TaxID=1776859 RepID=A0ABU0U9H9_9SPHI|nr:hypothetical protein [Sphingobacterium zeae]MDQ1151516.1 hypothetical protein [Sphingobacterium zeae]
MKLNEARDLSSYIKGLKCKAAQLRPTKTAEVFHGAKVAYMAQIADGYGVLLIKYIDEQKKGARKSLRREMTDKKARLAALADECFAHQLLFLRQAGIKVEKEQEIN